MVDELVAGGYLKSPRVIAAFKKVDRINFVPALSKTSAYNDTPLHLGSGQTISAPSMVGIMTEALKARAGNIIFEVGAGSGYQAALLSELVGPSGFVYTMERLPEVAEIARENLKNYNNVEVLVGDGTLGYLEKAPFNKIIVTAAAPKVPGPLVEQLKESGVLAIPVGGRWMQNFVLVKKTKKGVEEESVCGCVFVPLIGEYGWKT